MARKALRKQRNWIRKCRENVANGLINDAGGGWIRALSNNAMHRDMVAGYRIGNSGKKRRAKEKIEVE